MFEFLKRLLKFGGANDGALVETRAEQNHPDSGPKRLRAASFDLRNCSADIWQSEIGGFLGAAGVSSLACCCKSWRDRIVNDEILWRGLCEALWRGTALGRYAPQPTGSASKGAEKGSHGIGSYSNDISEFDSRGSSGSSSSSSSSSSSQNSAHPIGAMVGSDDYGGSENPLFGQWALCRCSRTPLDREQAVFTTLPLPRALAQRTAARRSWKQAGAAEAASTAGSARLGGDGGASAAGDEALLLEAVCEEVRLLSYRESYLASFKDRLRKVPLDVELVELSWHVRYFSFPFGIFALHQDARPWPMVFDENGFYGEGLYFDASAGARWGIEADGTVAYLPVGFRQALARTSQWGWQYANRVGRIDAAGTLRLKSEAQPPLLRTLPLSGDRPEGDQGGDQGAATPAASEMMHTAGAANHPDAAAAESAAPAIPVAAGAAAVAHGDGFTPAFRAKLAYNRALFGADLPLLSLYRALTGT